MSQSLSRAPLANHTHMCVIGTAGHVDHGKSTLVRALTGIDPDRLAEEKARAMTIDLGFAWLSLGNHPPIGIIDVPGHRDFIENMLAGIGGIDLVLLVIAADEGMMPQTREHLAIIDLLGIQRGIIVLSKIDLIDDPEWLSLIQDDIRAAVSGTTLSSAPIVPVSAVLGTGLDALQSAILLELAHLPPRPSIGAPRLPIDRVFTVSGFGTVVTGTLYNGSLRVGDTVELFPTGLVGRIRGLQSYKQTLNIAFPGSRTAVNIAGIDHTAVQRGMVLGFPGQLTPTTLIDVRFRHLPDTPHVLKHNTAVKLFVGAAEINAHVRLLDTEELPAGMEGWLQLRLDTPAAIAQGDHFIVRRPSPAETIGGGIVVDPHPASRWKRFTPSVIAALNTRLQGTPAQRLAQTAHTHEPIKRTALQKLIGYSDHDFAIALQSALDEGLMIVFPDDTLIAAERAHALIAAIYDELNEYHRLNPLRRGMPREELRSRLRIKHTTLTAILEIAPGLVQESDMVRRTDHIVRFTKAQQTAVDNLMRCMSDTPFTPPSFAEAAALVGNEVLHALIERGDVVQVQPDVIFSRAAYDELVSGVLSMIEYYGAVTVSQFRDRYNTSRKYAVGLLEHLDSLAITRREGDSHVRGRSVR